jgi:hypothetical protein
MLAALAGFSGAGSFLIFELGKPTTLRLVRLASALAALAAVAVFVGLVATGCGSSVVKVSAGSSPARNRTFQGPGAAQFQKFAACMKAHGVSNFGRLQTPSGGWPGTGTTTTPSGRWPGTGRTNRPPRTLTPEQQKALQKALTACRSLLPSGGFGHGRFGGTPNNQAPSAPTGSL